MSENKSKYVSTLEQARAIDTRSVESARQAEKAINSLLADRLDLLTMIEGLLIENARLQKHIDRYACRPLPGPVTVTPEEQAA